MSDDTKPDDPDSVSVVASLAEPTRRALYELVASSGDWVSRDAAAGALGLERGTAAHHLDRLVADGLLVVDYQRLSGRTGPGAGRPSKLYRRAAREFGVSLPPRSYDLAGRMLAAAADRARLGAADIDTTLSDAAVAEGHELAEKIRARQKASGARSVAARRVVALEVLADYGFEPHEERDGTVLLRNCPFHELAQAHTDLICGMNHCLMQSAADELGNLGFDPRLEPQEGYCCVKLHPAS